jgi:hypothetical protein
VRERERKIAAHAPCVDVVFLGKQAHVVAQCEQAFEQGARVGVAALHPIHLREPEAGGNERALVALATIGEMRRPVAQRQAVDQQLALRSRRRSPRPAIRRVEHAG